MLCACMFNGSFNRHYLKGKFDDVFFNTHTLTDWVRCLKFDDSKMVSGAFDETIKIWDMNTGKCLNTLKGKFSAFNIQHHQTLNINGNVFV